METKPWWESKTHWYNFLVGVLPLLATIIKWDALAQLQSEQIMAIATTWTGLLTVGNHYLRQKTGTAIGKSAGAGKTTAQSHWLLGAALFVVILLMAGCSAVKTAETPEQKAFALYSSYVIAQETAADLVESDGIPTDAVIVIANIDNIAAPVADVMVKTARYYVGLKAEIAALEAAGQPVPERRLEEVAIALNYLNRAIIEMEPLIRKLLRAIAEAQEYTTG